MKAKNFTRFIILIAAISKIICFILHTRKQWIKNIDGKELKDKDVILVQVIKRRPGMPLMGQTLFTKKLFEKKFKPATVKSVALCEKDDVVLRRLLEQHRNCEVVIYRNNKLK